MLIDAAQARIAASVGAAHEPTPATRELARIWSEIGVERHIIAKELGISTAKLESLYPEQIAGGEYVGVARVLTSLYVAANDGSVQAMIAYLNYKGSRTHLLDRQDDKPNITVQLDVVKSITSAISALRSGQLIEARPGAPAIEDGSDLI